MEHLTEVAKITAKVGGAALADTAEPGKYSQLGQIVITATEANIRPVTDSSLYCNAAITVGFQKWRGTLLHLINEASFEALEQFLEDNIRRVLT